MVWNVYIYNINKHKIEIYNIFEHGGFYKYVREAIKNNKNKEEFVEQLKSELLYYFWSKAEWEVIITSWCGGDKEKDAIKIDVYNQVMLNWDSFVNYVWNNKEEILKNKEMV